MKFAGWDQLPVEHFPLPVTGSPENDRFPWKKTESGPVNFMEIQMSQSSTLQSLTAARQGKPKRKIRPEKSSDGEEENRGYPSRNLIFETGHAPAVPGAGPGGRFQNGRESSSCRQAMSSAEIRSAASTAMNLAG